MTTTQHKSVIARKHQQGVTLLEMLAFIIILGMVLAAVYPKISTAIANWTAKNDLQDMQTLVRQYGGILDQQPNMSQCAVADAVANRAYPPKYFVDSTTLHNGYSGNITMAPASSNTACAFTTPNLTREACQLFAQSFGVSSVLVSVNGTALKADTSSQIVAATLNAACTDTQTNSVTITRPRGA